MKKGCLESAFVPTLCGSAFKNKGVQRVLDAVIDFLPSPTDVGSIQGSSVDNPDDSVEVKNSVDGSFTALAFKIATDPFVGKLTYIRVYSGSLKKALSVLIQILAKNKEFQEFFRCTLIKEKS